MNGSYQFEELEGRHQEADFLAERAQMRLEGFPDLLKRHSFPSQGKILEVGCGQGIRTNLISKLYPKTQIIGLDRSLELLKKIRTDENKENAPQFIKGDVYDLPFPDQSFDYVYARLVFMHLNNPQKALQEIIRVLRPGGRVLIEDADRDCMFFEPAPPSFSPFWAKVQEGQRRLGGDPNVGRKLAPLMKSFGLDVQIETQPITGSGLDIEFIVRTLMPSLNIYLNPEDRSQGEIAIKDLQELSQTPYATFYHFWFVVSGAKTC